MLTQIMGNETGSLNVFDLELDPTEHHRMLASQSHFTLRGPGKEDVSLTFREFKIVAVYIREWLLRDIRATMQSDGSARKLSDPAALPCASAYQQGTMCVKCKDCDKRSKKHRKQPVAQQRGQVQTNLGRKC